MIMFTNRVIMDYVYETRFIASWLKAGGQLKNGSDMAKFKRWLLSLGLTEDEADRIKFLAENGKLELQHSASNFLKNLN